MMVSAARVTKFNVVDLAVKNVTVTVDATAFVMVVLNKGKLC